MTGRVDGKVAIVTGGGSGIGKAAAVLLAAEGAAVVIADVQATGQVASEELCAAGHKAHFVHADVSSEADWDNLLAETKRVFGPPHVLVNNAGISGHNFGDWDSIEGWDQIMAVNAKSAYLGTRIAIREMLTAGHAGSIINVSSILGLIGTSGSHPAYHSSKGAMRLLSKATACRYGAQNIRVNSIHPGYMPAMVPTSEANTKRKIDPVDLTPLGRRGRPEEIAFGILFLASDESSFMTGSELVMDGGYTAR